MNDLDYIKKFAKITISGACLKTNVNRVNLLRNKTTAENERKVREEIENQIARLYLKEE